LTILNPIPARTRVTPDRRGKVRYPIQFEVRFRVLDKHRPSAGVGHSVNISSSGLLVAAAHDILPGARVEVKMNWPYLLDGSTPLQLVATGRVVRCEHATFGVVFHQYLFCTMNLRQRLASQASNRFERRTRSVGNDGSFNGSAEDSRDGTPAEATMTTPRFSARPPAASFRQVSNGRAD
jgi:hypothetical protein